MTVPPTDSNAELEADDDLLSDLDMAPATEVESDAEIMATLDSSDDDTHDDETVPTAPVAGWLADVRELARKHGPFAPWQIDQIILALSAPDSEASR